MHRSSFSVVMYHFVRSETRDPLKVPARTPEEFKNQIEFLLRNYNPITLTELIAAVKGESTLPESALLFTFDDGYIDHYECVMPILCEYGLSGVFFIPTLVVKRERLLDVNRIHYLLSNLSDDFLAMQIDYMIENFESELLCTANEYRKNIAKLTGHRFDSPQRIYVKRMLQSELPEDIRTEILTTLFHKFVTDDEAGLAEQLYLNERHIDEMLSAGMFIGGHGATHSRLNTIDTTRQREEVLESKRFVEMVGDLDQPWVFSYPNGVYDDSLLKILQDTRCELAFTTIAKNAYPNANSPLLIPRFDTNDFPII